MTGHSGIECYERADCLAKKRSQAGKLGPYPTIVIQGRAMVRKQENRRRTSKNVGLSTRYERSEGVPDRMRHKRHQDRTGNIRGSSTPPTITKE